MDAQPVARRPLGAVGERLPGRTECYHLPPRRPQARVWLSSRQSLPRWHRATARACSSSTPTASSCSKKGALYASVRSRFGSSRSWWSGRVRSFRASIFRRRSGGATRSSTSSRASITASRICGPRSATPRSRPGSSRRFHVVATASSRPSSACRSVTLRRRPKMSRLPSRPRPPRRRDLRGGSPRSAWPSRSRASSSPHMARAIVRIRPRRPRAWSSRRSPRRPATRISGLDLPPRSRPGSRGQQLVAVQPMGRDAKDASGGSDGVLVLRGEIRTTGPDVRVLARLENPAGGTVWSERFNVRADRLFSVEDVVAERVVGALNLRLAAADQDRLRRRYTRTPPPIRTTSAVARAMVRYTQEATLEAIHAFESALRLDPGYTLARAGLAMACADMYLRFAPARDIERWGARAEAEARAALDIDPDLAEGHLARAAVARKREFDWNATLTASRSALVLNPSLDQARYFMAAAYYHLGYMDESLIEMKKGRDLRGADIIEPIRIEALVALFSGNFGPARVHLEEVSRLSSRAIGDTYLALAYYYSGSMPRGREMLDVARDGSLPLRRPRRAGAALAGVLAAHGGRRRCAASHRRRPRPGVSRPPRRVQSRRRLRAIRPVRGSGAVAPDFGRHRLSVPHLDSTAIHCSNRCVAGRTSRRSGPTCRPGGSQPCRWNGTDFGHGRS